MPNWRDVLNETKELGSPHDIIRRNYLSNLNKVTDRNVIVYYSGWLQKPRDLQKVVSLHLDDGDKNGFMTTIHQLDRSKGLDLLLHTPGGEVAATESLVDYLRSMFGKDIRAIVPQIAMSAGTMIALSCKEIVMGKHSSLGPIDPQIAGLPAHGIIEEFERARKEIQQNQLNIPLWQPIIAKYSPTLVGEAKKAMDWADDMVKAWLKTGMFDGEADAQAKVDKIVKELADHALTKSHARHISFERAKSLGIKVRALEDSDALQDAVLSVHHACIQTLSSTPAFKIIQNQLGVAFIQQAQIGLAAG
jgi:membrane-bound ClpP family serine protease